MAYCITMSAMGCGEEPQWHRMRDPAAVEYVSRSVMGLPSPTIKFGGSDTVWVVSNGMVVHSVDGGVHWTKRIIGGSLNNDFFGYEVAVSGPQIWVGQECTIRHSPDEGRQWRESSVMPGCDLKHGLNIRGIAASQDRVWVGAESGLFEVSSDLKSWTQHLKVSPDTLKFWDFIASDRWFWLVSHLRLYYASAENPTAWRTHTLSIDGESIVDLAAAAGDTVWVAKRAQFDVITRALTAPGSLYPVVTDSGGARQLAAIPLPMGDSIWHNGERVFMSTTDGLYTLNDDGSLVSRLYEPTKTEICALQYWEGYWYVFFANGSTTRSDSTFLWTLPTESDPNLVHADCSVGQLAWAIGSDEEGPGIFHRSGARWTMMKRLGPSDTLSTPWIHAAGNHVWASTTDDDGHTVLYHSSDAGLRWTATGLNNVSVQGSGQEVWMLRRGDRPNTVSRLDVIGGRNSGEGVDLPAGSVDAWVAGDSIWIVTAGDIQLSTDWGRTWEHRKVPAGNPLVGIRVDGPVLTVREQDDDFRQSFSFSSTDGGFNWRWGFGGWLGGGPATSKYPMWQNGGTSVNVLEKHRVFPQISHYRVIHSLASVKLELLLDTAQATVSTDSFTFDLAGVDSHDRLRSEFDPFENACRRIDGTARWVCSFSPMTAGIRPGEDGHLLLTLRYGDFRHSYILPPFTFLPLWRRVPPPLLWAALSYGSLLVLAGCLLLLRPLWLHRLYWGLRQHASSVPWIGGTLAETTLDFLLPFFAHHSRVLDAWVEHHASAVEHAFHDLDARLVPPEQYVPLPLDVLHLTAGAGESLVPVRRIMEPTAETFRPFFRGERTLLEIVGAGGSGKTTLALRVVGWALGRAGKTAAVDERLASHRMLPVWVDEEAEDLLKIATRQLRAWTEESLAEEFVRSLLRHGRAVVVLDRLSERSAKMQRYVRSARGELRIKRMIVTSRALIPFETSVTTYLGTRELTFESLARLVGSRLSICDPDPDLRSGELPRPHPSWTAEKQAELTTRITRLFRIAPEVSENDTIPLQPLLVRIAVDESATLRRTGSPAASLAASVPHLIENYLVSLNPSDAEVNGLAHPTMLRAAQLAAILELGTRYQPRSFSRAEARAEFASKNWNIDSGPDPLQRLISNGVLVDEGAGFMRFRLDPVAEYVAADAMVQEYAQDPEAWKSVTEAVTAAGAHSYSKILLALRHIRFAKVE